ncbi:MAG: hypothetical protein V7641_5668 [Blastocatellia bacterium]
MRKLLPIKPLICAGVLIFLLFANLAARADDLDNITFHGAVRDSAGAAIVGAHVSAMQTATGVERAGVTDSEGRYRITVNAPGSYTLKVMADGFSQTESKEIAVTSGRVVALDFALQPSGVTEQVTVTATNLPLIDTTRTVTGDTITRRELDELPIANRDPLQLVFLLGGVAEAPLTTANLADEGRGVFVRNSPEEAGIFSLTGAPATSNNLTIDGLDNNDDRAARERISLNPEAIAEVQIITNQYAAEYGRASGGRINLRTRGGANELRGEGYFYFGDESLNANTYFRNARGLGRVPQQQRREGATVSGPIQRQRHFFFGSYERFDVTDSAEIDATVPVAANPLFPLPPPNQPVSAGSIVGLFTDDISTPETRNVINGRADFNFTAAHNASVRFDAQRGANKRGFPGGARLLDTILIEGRNSDSISGTDNYIFSSHLVNQARAQYSRLLPRNKAGADSISIIILDPERVTAGAYTGSDGSPAFAREERRFQLQDNLSLILGSHLFKVGVDAQLVRSSFADLFASGGEFTFASVEDFLANRPEQFVQRFDTESKASNNVLGLFAQDEWHLRSNLTLSFGLRWDNESILQDRDNFSPRLAVAWDPFGGKLFRKFKKFAEPGKTVVRAGFGLFYNRALLRTIDDFSLGRSTLAVNSDITSAVLDSVTFPTPLSDRSLIDRFGILEASFLRRVSPDLKIPYTLQTGIGVERQITKKMVATADYIFTRGAHLWRETNINAPRVPEGFANFTDYLLSRDFDNRPSAAGKRPVSGANADVVRFDLGANTSTTSGAIQVHNGVRILTLGLNTPGSANVTAALNAIRLLRPDPTLTQVEMLESTGNSY